MAVKRTTIVDAIVTRLTAINAAAVTAGTYHRALVTVEAFRTVPLEPGREEGDTAIATELPAAVVRDLDDEPTNNASESSYSITDHDMNVRIELAAAAGATLAALREHMADIYKAIGTDEKWSTNAIGTDPIRDRILVSQTDRKILGAEIDIRVKYRTQRWQES